MHYRSYCLYSPGEADLGGRAGGFITSSSLLGSLTGPESHAVFIHMAYTRMELCQSDVSGVAVLKDILAHIYCKPIRHIRHLTERLTV